MELITMSTKGSIALDIIDDIEYVKDETVPQYHLYYECFIDDYVFLEIPNGYITYDQNNERYKIPESLFNSIRNQILQKHHLCLDRNKEEKEKWGYFIYKWKKKIDDGRKLHHTNMSIAEKEFKVEIDLNRIKQKKDLK